MSDVLKNWAIYFSKETDNANEEHPVEFEHFVKIFTGTFENIRKSFPSDASADIEKFCQYIKRRDSRIRSMIDWSAALHKLQSINLDARTFVESYVAFSEEFKKFLPISEYSDQKATKFEIKTKDGLVLDRRQFQSLRETYRKYKETITKYSSNEMEESFAKLAIAIGEKSEFESKITDRVGGLDTALNAQIDHKFKEFQINLVINDAAILWSIKARNHRIMYAIGASLFIGAISFFVGCAIIYWPNLIGALPEEVFKDHPFGGLALMLIPILAIAWVLRLISRFTLNNMMLADDAHQRSVMVNTFLKLVSTEVGGDQMEPTDEMRYAVDADKDRTIILNAIFRPLPGTVQEDIQPPSLLDLLNKK